MSYHTAETTEHGTTIVRTTQGTYAGKAWKWQGTYLAVIHGDDDGRWPARRHLHGRGATPADALADAKS